MIDTAVIPVAGFGTRMLPASKSTPKELLPLADKPILQFIIDECQNAGITHVVLVTHSSKNNIEDFFDRNFELEQSLISSQKNKLLAEVRAISPKNMTISSVRQQKALGLGHAILAAKNVVGNKPFAVLLPDVLVENKEKGNLTSDLVEMIESYTLGGASQILVEPVDIASVSSYGVVAGEVKGNDFSLTDIVEKPSPQDAPSNLAVVGRYILSSSIWKCLESTSPGAGNEVQLTDAIKQLIQSEEVVAKKISGVSRDCGCKLGYYQAFVEKVLEQNNVTSDEFRNFIVKIAEQLMNSSPSNIIPLSKRSTNVSKKIA